MKKVWHIAWKDIRLKARDPSSFIVLLLMPLLLILILGTVFQGSFKESTFRVPVAYLDEDQGELSRVLKEDVLESPELSQMLIVKEVGSREEAQALPLEGKVSCSIIVPRDFSAKVLAGQPAELEVIADPGQSIKAGVIRNIVEEFAVEVNRRQVIVSTALKELTSRNLIAPSQIESMVSRWLSQLESLKDQISVESTQAEAGLRTRSAMDYYAVGMGAMYLIFAANAGSKTILEEKRTGTTIRLLTAPIKPFSLLSGKLLGIVLFTLVQFLLIILFSALVYRVYWGSSILGIALMILGSVFAISGLGALLASFFKTESQAAAIGPAVALILAFLGGGMVPIYAWPSWATFLSRLTPNRWIQEGFLTLMSGGGISGIPLPLVVLGGMGFVMFFVASFRLRMRIDV